MAIFKCKMCGGNIEFNPGDTIGICDSCGSKQTLPNSYNDVINNLYNRANTLRIKSDFDRAEEIYNKIISADNTQSEAYWGIILCKYGIEYVEDPKTFNRIPTCHRTSFDAITADEDFKLAIKYGDAEQRKLYIEEAKKIDAIQKNILKIVNNEKPFDVFLCYKETDGLGKRTQDSVIANEIYHQLNQEGFKVFFAAITLEDRLGQEYEPYIFAALNSAKVMLVIGTKPEYFTSVWVKNEWSRFLKLMKNDHSKLLIPCYKDMDAYELPDDFAHLQAQDISKIGFINDITRGIKKVLYSNENDILIRSDSNSAISNETGNIHALLDRGFMELEDGEWQKADEFFEQALNLDAKIGIAYLGKLMAELHVNRPNELNKYEKSFENSSNYRKAIRFGSQKLQDKLQADVKHINSRNKRKEEFLRKKAIYKSAKMKMDKHDYNSAIAEFQKISDFKDSNEQIDRCRQKAEEQRIKIEKAKLKKRKIIKFITPVIAVLIIFVIIFNTVIFPSIRYNKAMDYINNNDYFSAISLLNKIYKYKDSKSLLTDYYTKYYPKSISVGGAYYYNGNGFSVGVCGDGTMAVTKKIGFKNRMFNDYDIMSWKEIISVSAGLHHVVGLKSDGTVVATEYIGDLKNYDGQCDVDGWSNIVDISTGSFHTVGLKSNGKVVATGKNYNGQCNVDDWKDIVAVSASESHTIGLKSDGTVIAVGTDAHGACDVSSWNDIVAISTGGSHTAGIKSDGTVIDTDSTIDVSAWKDIVAISAGGEHIVGIKADGTVVAAGDNYNGQCNVNQWKDIAAIFTGPHNTIGLKSDGSVVATGYNLNGECNVDDWKDIKVPNNK